MKEIKDIIKAYRIAVEKGKQTALATVVHLQGSAYRRPGARMLVTDDGMLTGAISGGCLEGDALRKAQLAMVQQKPMLVTYDTTDDDDSTLGVGLGCNGIISILIEPVNATAEFNPVKILEHAVSQRRPACVATIFSLDKTQPQPGTCFINADGTIGATDAMPRDVQSEVEGLSLDVLEQKHSHIKNLMSNSMLMVFAECVKPPVSLLIFGAGNDSIPLVQMASVLGWQTIIIDGRSNYATHQRFPLASQLLVSKPDGIMNQLEVDEQTAVLLMTHNYSYDIAVLKQLADLPVSYTGVLGPKKKLDRMLDELRDQGCFLNGQTLANLYGPSGLDLGSESPEEIALSIIAEVKAVLSHRLGTSLREKKAAIHA